MESTRGLSGAWLFVNGLVCFLPAAADHADIGLMRESLHRHELDRLSDPIRYDRLTSDTTAAADVTPDT